MRSGTPKRFALVLALLSVPATACWQIIGGGNVALDAGPPDGACPTVSPGFLMTPSTNLAGMFTSSDYVFAQPSDLAPTRSDFFLTSGFISCPIGKLCGASPDVPDIYDPNTLEWGSAISGGSKVFFTLSTLADASINDAGVTDAPVGMLKQADFDGGSVTTLAKRLQWPYLVAASGDDIFWTNDPTLQVGLEFGAPWSLEHIHLGQPPDSQPYIRGGSGPTYQLFTDSVNVYVLGWGARAPQLLACPLSGCKGGPTVIATSSSDSAGNALDYFAADGQYAYQASAQDGTIVRIALGAGGAGGAGVTNTLASNQESPANLAVDSSYVYWSVATGAILRTSKDGGGGATPLVCGLQNISGIVSQGGKLFFIASNPHVATNMAAMSIPLPQ